MLILQRRVGESVLIGESVTVRIASVDGSRVRLAISAPEDIPILRSELVIATAANRDAAAEESAPIELLDLLGAIKQRPASSQSEQPQGKEEQP